MIKQPVWTLFIPNLTIEIHMKDLQNRIAFKKDKTKLKEFDTTDSLDLSTKAEGKKILKKNRVIIAEEADKLYANDKYAILFIIQAMDAAKKDSTVKHVFSDIQPQVLSFAQFNEPTSRELEHDYLWRVSKSLPKRGQIGIFNRSHYEEVIVTRVHPELIMKQNLPGMNHPDDVNEEFWLKRFEQINNYENHLSQNGYMIIKVFLHMSREKQRQRFLRRIRRSDKQWKFKFKDIEERQHWQSYQYAYEEALKHTSTPHAPWYVVPADRKWIIRATVSEIVVSHLKKLSLRYPELSKEEKQQLDKVKEMLINE